VELVPPELFDRGRRLALRLAEEPPRTVLLHGDFTPVNILDGGARRGLVAVDPSPCLGDPAFDAVDLLFWQASDVKTISHRVEVLAPAMGVDATRLLEWCTALADIVGPGQRQEPPDDNRSERVRAALSLAAPGSGNVFEHGLN
jgi:streptomycin 6-kinase